MKNILWKPSCILPCLSKINSYLWIRLNINISRFIKFTFFSIFNFNNLIIFNSILCNILYFLYQLSEINSFIIEFKFLWLFCHAYFFYFYPLTIFKQCFSIWYFYSEIINWLWILIIRLSIITKIIFWISFFCAIIKNNICILWNNW